MIDNEFWNKHLNTIGQLKPFALGKVVIIDNNFADGRTQQLYNFIGHVVGFTTRNDTEIVVRVQIATNEIRHVPPQYLTVL